MAVLLEGDGSEPVVDKPLASLPVARQLDFVLAPPPGAATEAGPTGQPARRNLAPAVFRPRLVLTGDGLGRDSVVTVARAALHLCGNITVQSLETVTLLADPSRSVEVRKTAPRTGPRTA